MSFAVMTMMDGVGWVDDGGDASSHLVAARRSFRLREKRGGARPTLTAKGVVGRPPALRRRGFGGRQAASARCEAGCARC